MANYTFRPMGNTSLIAGTTTASAAIQPSTGNIGGCALTNLSTNDVWVAFGSSSVVAVLPTTATPGNAFPVTGGLHNVIPVLAPPNFWISALTSAGTAVLAITPGLSL